MSQLKILVTGGRGFLGKSVCRQLESQDKYEVTALSGKSAWDLTKQKYVDYALHEFTPDIVIHLAATVGGIGANKENPGLFMYDNLAMGMNLIESCRKYGKLQKFVMVGTVCAYPKFTNVPFKEEDIWKGYPEETNAPYGIAKKALMELLIAYHKQYNFPAINLIPVNMYGPHDNFHPKISHVIPALILKIQKAIDEHRDTVVCWGTGDASREFLYVDDCAQAIALSIGQDNIGPEPINIGTGKEITIFDLVYMLKDLMGYEGDIEWDTSKPDGQPRRCLDTSRAEKAFSFTAQTDLKNGLQQTIDWFNNNKEQFVDYFDHIQ